MLISRSFSAAVAAVRSPWRHHAWREAEACVAVAATRVFHAMKAVATAAIAVTTTRAKVSPTSDEFELPELAAVMIVVVVAARKTAVTIANRTASLRRPDGTTRRAGSRAPRFAWAARSDRTNVGRSSLLWRRS